MRPLILPELGKKPVCVGIACRAPVQVFGLSILESFTPREHFLHGGKSDLQTCPEGETLGGRVGNPHPEFLETCFDSRPMPALGLRHPPEDRRSFRIAFMRRHRLVHGACFNLPPPRGQEAGDWFLGAVPISLIHHACPLAARSSSARLIGRCRRASSDMRSMPSISPSPKFPLAFRLIFSAHLQGS